MQFHQKPSSEQNKRTNAISHKATYIWLLCRVCTLFALFLRFNQLFFFARSLCADTVLACVSVRFAMEVSIIFSSGTDSTFTTTNHEVSRYVSRINANRGKKMFAVVFIAFLFSSAIRMLNVDETQWNWIHFHLILPYIHFFRSFVPYWFVLVTRFLCDCHIDYVDSVLKPLCEYVRICAALPPFLSCNTGRCDLDSTFFLFVRSVHVSSRKKGDIKSRIYDGLTVLF